MSKRSKSAPTVVHKGGGHYYSSERVVLKRDANGKATKTEPTQRALLAIEQDKFARAEKVRLRRNAKRREASK